MNAPIKKAAVGAADQKSFNAEFTAIYTVNGDNSTQSQRDRLLDALKEGPVTTLSARQTLDVMHPAARAQELRERGHNIVTVWSHNFTSEGNQHRVAKYVLIPRCSETMEMAEKKRQGRLFDDEKNGGHR